MRHGAIAMLALIPGVIAQAHKEERAAPIDDVAAPAAERAHMLQASGRAAERVGELVRAQELYSLSAEQYRDAYPPDHPLVENIGDAKEIIWLKLKGEATPLEDLAPP
jgi:hypothetical protein